MSPYAQSGDDANKLPSRLALLSIDPSTSRKPSVPGQSHDIMLLAEDQCHPTNIDNAMQDAAQVGQTSSSSGKYQDVKSVRARSGGRSSLYSDVAKENALLKQTWRRAHVPSQQIPMIKESASQAEPHTKKSTDIIVFDEASKTTTMQTAGATSTLQGTAKQTSTKPYSRLAQYQGLNPKRCQVMTKEICTVGQVIRGAVHEQDFHDEPGWVANEQDKFTVISECGAVYSKVRWLIVVAVFETHYLSIPCYTHNGRGLSHKDEAARDEFISIQDGRYETFKKLSSHRPLKTVPKSMARLLSTKTVAHLTHPIPRKFGMLVEFEGELNPERPGQSITANS